MGRLSGGARKANGINAAKGVAMSGRELTVMIAMCAVWGFHFVVVKVALGEIPPIFYAALRMTLVAVLLAPLLKWRPGRMREVLIAGLCLGAANYAFMFTGLSLTTASSGAVAIELYVPFATLLSVIFLKEKVGWRRIAGIALAFTGVAIIAIFRGEAAGGNGATVSGLGIGLVAMAAMTEAFGAILVKRSEEFKPIELLAWFAVVGAAFLWPATLIVETGQADAVRDADKALIVGAVAYSAIAASIFAHSAYYWLLRRLPVSQASSSALLATIFAVICGVVILGDRLSPTFFVGGLMTLAGVGVILMRTPDKPRVGAAPAHAAVGQSVDKGVDERVNGPVRQT